MRSTTAFAAVRCNNVYSFAVAYRTSPTASSRKEPAQVALASSTVSPMSSKASRTEASSPAGGGPQLSSMNTLTRKRPFLSRTPTLTDDGDGCCWQTLVACCGDDDVISWLSFAIFCFSSLMYDDASAIMDTLSPCMRDTHTHARTRVAYNLTEHWNGLKGEWYVDIYTRHD